MNNCTSEEEKPSGGDGNVAPSGCRPSIGAFSQKSFTPVSLPDHIFFGSNREADAVNDLRPIMDRKQKRHAQASHRRSRVLLCNISLAFQCP